MNRKTAPEIQAIKTIHTGFPVSENSIYRIPSSDGVFKLEIVFENGGYGNAENKLAAICGMDLILSGTDSKNAAKIAEEIDGLGGFVFKSCDYYTSSISIFGLNENFSELLKITSYAISNCIYAEDELNLFKAKKISELNVNLNKTSFLANRRIHHILFGQNHPFAKSSDVSDIQAINRNDLEKYRSGLSGSVHYIFTGPEDLDLNGILKNSGLLDYQTGLKTGFTERLPEEEELPWYCEKTGSTQSSIRFGKILPSRKHKDFFTISMFNLILGGYFGSRLMKNIREEKGLTYGIHSSLSPFREFTLFRISSECNQKLSETVKEEIIKEIEALQKESVSEEELETARNYLLGAMLRNFDGAFNISERFKSSLDLGTEDDYYKRYFEAINSIRPADIQKCANNYFKIDTLKYCLSGEK